MGFEERVCDAGVPRHKPAEEMTDEIGTTPSIQISRGPFLAAGRSPPFMKEGEGERAG
jgi:hypothetical protein